MVHPSTASLSRRSVARGLAWAVPAVVGVAPAPAMAASSAALCTYTAQFVTSPATAVTSLIATSPTTSRTIRVTLTQQTGPCTTVTTDNMTTGGEGTQQGYYNCCETQRFVGFGPSTAITLNQVTTNTGCVREGQCATTHDSQTVTFAFVDPVTGAAVGTVQDVRLTVFDISSVSVFSGQSDPASNTACSQWRGMYYDAVGFNQAPTQIIPAPQDRGTGSGTVGDPFRRSASHLPSSNSFQWSDTFVFGSVPGPLTLTYSNLFYGYHFIALSGLTFQGPC